MADSFLDVDPVQLGTPTYAEAPLDPTTSGLPELGAYSTNLILEKPTSILPSLLSSTFDIPSVNIDVGNIVGDAKDSVSDLKLPSIDLVEEESKKEGIDPVDWVDENIVKPIDQSLIRPIDQLIEEQLVDPTTGFIKNVFQPVEGFIGNLDDYLDKKFAGFTTPTVLEELQAAGGEFIGAAEGINNFKKNPNSTTAAEFLNSIDKIYGTATGQGAAQIKLPELELIEGAGGVTGDQTIEGSRLFNAETINNFQNVAGVYNIANYLDNPTVEGSAAAYGDILHLSEQYAPEVYNVLGADTAVNVVGELANIVKVIDALEALEGGVDGIGEALTVTSGISAGAAAATSLGIATEGGVVAQVGALAGPLAIASLGYMAYELTKDQDFPRSFASIEYDPENSYQSGFYVSSQVGPEFVSEQQASGVTSYAVDAQAGKNYGGYGPFKYGEGRAIDGGSKFKPDSALMASQEFANWMVTGLGYQVDEAAFKKFAADGSNFIGDGDVGYLQARHGYKGIKKDGYDLITDMIKKGVFVATDDTIVLDSEDWKTSLTYLKETGNDPSLFLHKRLADISDPLQFAPAEIKEQMKVAEQQASQAEKEAEERTKGYRERQKQLEEDPELQAEEIKNSYIQGIFDAEGSLEDKISAVENIIAVDTSTIINSAFNPQKALIDAYSPVNLGPNNPYTRLNESEYFAAKSPFGFYGTLPYIG